MIADVYVLTLGWPGSADFRDDGVSKDVNGDRCVIDVDVFWIYIFIRRGWLGD